MAEIKVREEEIVVRKASSYVLVLSRAEVEVLAAILAKFGGSQHTSHRKYAKDIADALSDVGVDWYTTEAYASLNGEGGMFEDVESLSEDF